MARMQMKSFETPDDRKTFDKAAIDVINLGGITVKRFTFQPGWRWSQSVKPVVKTEWCENAHHNVHIAGRLGVKMSDGTEQEFGPGEISVLPPNHDAWVVGNESVIIIEQTPPKA